MNRLYNEFSSGERISTSRCPGSGRPTTASDEEHEDLLINLMDQDRTWIIDELVETMNISHGTVQSLLVKHGYRKVGPTWLPHELSCYDKARRVGICRQFNVV